MPILRSYLSDPTNVSAICLCKAVDMTPKLRHYVIAHDVHSVGRNILSVKFR